ncbi:MAG: MarR family transcriptional regulator [Actinocatenispora sp.]
MNRAGEATRDEAGTVKFLERFASAMTDTGLPRMPARVFAALFVTDSGRLTAAELAEALQVSPAAISGAVRYLGQINLVSREREPGSRRDHFVVRDDVWQQLIGRRDQILVRVEDSLRDGITLVGADTAAGRRAAETIAFFEFLQNELPDLMTKWYAQRDARD